LKDKTIDEPVIIVVGDVVLRNSPVAVFRIGQVLVQVCWVGVCGSDVHVYHRKCPFATYPVVQGHKFSGIILIHASEWFDPSSINSPHGTYNNTFWDPYTKKDRGYTCGQSDGAGKVVTYTESKDFLNWTDDKQVYGIYDSRVPDYVWYHLMDIFSKGNVYIRLLGAIVFRQSSAPCGDDNKKQHIDLAWSLDDTTWHRIGQRTSFIEYTQIGAAVCSEMRYDWECIFATAPVFPDNELPIYHGA